MAAAAVASSVPLVSSAGGGGVVPGSKQNTSEELAKLVQRKADALAEIYALAAQPRPVMPDLKDVQDLDPYSLNPNQQPALVKESRFGNLPSGWQLVKKAAVPGTLMLNSQPSLQIGFYRLNSNGDGIVKEMDQVVLALQVRERVDMC